jgi:hypothetical protein
MVLLNPGMCPTFRGTTSRNFLPEGKSN